VTTSVVHDILQYKGLLLNGLLQTMLLAVAVIATGLAGGLALMIIRNSRIPVLSHSVSAWVYFCRNIPLIMFVALMHYGVLPFLGYAMDFFFSAWLAMSLSASAYFAEVYRGGLKTLKAEEKEAAHGLGLGFWQQLRFVVVPLILLRMAPALINQSVSLIKDTSLASLIGVIELTRAAEIVYEHTFHEGEMLCLIALVYFVLSYSVSNVGRVLQQRAKSYQQ
jgi:His/Glu/Gln/Arg/opine family amino acid ABC transporter permease subunit